MKHDLIDRQISEGTDYLTRFCLWEKQFKTYAPPRQLSWKSIPAKITQKQHLPKTQGVYAFVVKPSPVELAWSGYILYVGKTEAQTFQARFQQYFNEPKKKKPRYWISKMLKLWKNNLHYYYAETPAKDAGVFEDALLEALLPPNNERFPGTLGKIKKEIYR